MSATRYEEVRCPAAGCGEEFEAELCYSVNAQQNPELREQLLAGELNVVRCPRCGEMFYAEYFMIYIDADRELLAFVYPRQCEAEKEQWEKRMNDDFARARETLPDGKKPGYPPLVFFGMDGLLKLIETEETQLDEIAVLENIHENLGLGIVRLKPSDARRRRLPPVLPSGNSGSAGCGREELMAGLRRLLGAMPDLDSYRRALDVLEKETSPEKYELSDSVKNP